VGARNPALLNLPGIARQRFSHHVSIEDIAMHLVSFVRTGTTGYGALVGPDQAAKGIVDLSRLLGAAYPDLRSVLEADALDELAELLKDRRPDFALSDVTLLPVIPNPGKILCIGLNYETHRAETKRPDAKYPTLFPRYADSQVGAGQPLIMPCVSDHFDFEGELAVIIGRGGRYIPEAQAMDHIAGYAPYNDATVRDWQRHTHQFMPGKTFPGTGGFGPALVTADEVPDYRALTVVTRLSGEVMQNGSLADLIFPIPRLIAYCSSFTPLSPGDVILTGTPGGVGDRRDPPRYMKAGEVVEVEISGVGLLRNPVLKEA
jgi:2-keto-4-pentenoate hydratase/2-oxohepta-3-ene-1,7-dioic acid hydratase in catechol pathway